MSIPLTVPGRTIACAIACAATLFALSPGAALPAFAATAHTDSLLRARQLYDKGDFRRAVEAYTKSLSTCSDCASAVRGRGLAYMRIGDFERAVQDFSRAEAELGPYRERKFPGLGGYLEWKRAQEEYQDANQYLAKESYEQAIGMYRVALSIYPHYPQCLHNLAIALSKTGDYKAAEIACMEAISIRHDDWKFWRTLALQFFHQHKLHSSLQALKKAMDLNPPLPDRAQLIDDVGLVEDYIDKQLK